MRRSCSLRAMSSGSSSPAACSSTSPAMREWALSGRARLRLPIRYSPLHPASTTTPSTIARHTCGTQRHGRSARHSSRSSAQSCPVATRGTPTRRSGEQSRFERAWCRTPGSCPFSLARRRSRTRSTRPQPRVSFLHSGSQLPPGMRFGIAGPRSHSCSGAEKLVIALATPQSSPKCSLAVPEAERVARRPVSDSRRLLHRRADRAPSRAAPESGAVDRSIAQRAWSLSRPGRGRAVARAPSPAHMRTDRFEPARATV